MFSAAFLYELPLGKGKSFLKSGIGGAILGGWVANRRSPPLSDRSAGFVWLRKRHSGLAELYSVQPPISAAGESRRA